MEAQDLERAVRMMGEVLEPLSAHDWSVAAGTLDWTCRETLAHIGHDLLAYAAQVAGRVQDAYLPLDLVIRDDAPVSDVLLAVEACGGLLVAALRAAGPDTRAWHFGSCDVSGFAALGVAEVVLHTYDITRGLKVNWWPPAKFSTRILARLAPDATTQQRQKTGKREHASHVLLRHTGRLGDVGPWQWRIMPDKQRVATENAGADGARRTHSVADPNVRERLAVIHKPTEDSPVQRDPVATRAMSADDDDLGRRRVDWLYQYTSLKNVIAAVRDVPYTCPCCGHATLSERGSYEICDECSWEDDGQDNHDSAVVRGGPNGSLSLDEARVQYIRKGRGRTPQPHLPPSEPT
ncbi:CPCC family cysteine-rich protein [Micromonospora nigra]|nr:CPCC family cysteine-rich protein [Micromonospora nigra]